MWLLFHRKAGTKVVVGGECFSEHCPTCARQTRFEEIEQSEQLGVWFIDILGDTKRAYRCRVCGDVFDLRETEDAPEPKPQIDRTEQLALEQRRRDAERAVRETRIDDELAELKRRMGR